MFLNVQGLCPQTVPSKVPFVKSTLCDKNNLFVGLSETWLKDQKEAELKIEGYTLFRCDTKRKQKARGRHTGGVGIYVRDNTACSCEILFSHSSECVQMLCLYSSLENIAIMIVYRQPDDKYNGHPSTDADFNVPLKNAKDTLLKLNPSPNIIIGGDFNLPHVSWPEGKPTPGATIHERSMIHSLNEFSNDLFLSQYVKKPTHKDGNILDLLFVNNPDLVHHYIVIPNLYSTSHHSTIEVGTPYMAKSNSATEDKRDQRSMFNTLNFFSEKINWNIITQELQALNWEQLLENCNTEAILDVLYSTTFEICRKHVPPRKQNRLKTSKIVRYRNSLTKRRRKLKKQIASTTSETKISKINTELLEIEKKLQKSFRESSASMEHKAVNAIKANSKYFYSYVKKNSKVSSKVGPLINQQGELTNNNKEMADILSQQYAKVFSKPKDQPPIYIQPQSESTLNNISFNAKDFEDAIDELKSNSAAGPDGFPAILLKNCKKELSCPLVLLWKSSLHEGCVPEKLKKSLVTPIHKGGSRATAANYRPVALTSHLIKIFEKIIKKNVVKHMDDNNLFNENQHGFRAGRSCLSQLLEQYDLVLDILNNQANADVVYLDFSKAFDKVDHTIALNKIKSHGIEGSLYRWLESFLRNRHQTVMVNGIISEPQEVVSGVPQGSVLGPLIFVILISDIDKKVVNSKVKSFADDTRATKKIKTIEDSTLLQEDLNEVYGWTDTNNALLNDLKFELLRYGTNEALKSSDYTTPSGSIIEVKQDVKDLGVYMSSDCSFAKQINTTIEKAKSQISWILRSFKTRDRTAMMTLYKSLVIPILEYCSVLWSPTIVGHIQSLENVQWSFLRKIKSSPTNDYWSCLKEMNVFSLQRRRERYRILYIWKVLENLVPNTSGKIRCYNNNRRGRLCEVPMVQQGRLGKLYENSFVVNGAKLFNILPKKLRDMVNVTLLSFKSALDNHLGTIPDEPQINGYTSRRRADTNSLLHMHNLACSVAGPLPFQDHHNRRGELNNQQA